jgi:hypothetical protein
MASDDLHGDVSKRISGKETLASGKSLQKVLADAPVMMELAQER